MAFAALIGISLGIVSAIRQNTFIDYFFPSVGGAPFLFAGLLVWLNGAGRILPQFRMAAIIGRGLVETLYITILDVGRERTGFAAAHDQNQYAGCDQAGPIRTARAKGASERRVVVRHMLRNGMLPVVTQVGISYASCMGGSVVTESVFSIPGVGSLLVNSVKSRDIPVVMGTIIFVAVFVGIINLLVDLLYAWIDPRVKLTQ